MTAFQRLALARAAVDRAGELRADEEFQAGAWAAASTRVLVLNGGEPAEVHEGPGGTSLGLVPPSDAPAGDRFFLGRDGGDVAYYAVVTPAGHRPSGRGLRELGAVLGDRDAGLLVAAVSLANWHATHGHCGRCGARTEPASAGWTRRCPTDGSEHYPRTDPAVIMAVTDAEDRLLLGHAPQWPEGRFSTLAGFVEPGESLEQAVRREVLEEAGVVIGDVHYRGSQPWPFPASLMVAFRAEALTTELRLSEELTDARWLTRPELAAEVAAGSLLLPGDVSIARRLVEDWYGTPLPG